MYNIKTVVSLLLLNFAFMDVVIIVYLIVGQGNQYTRIKYIKHGVNSFLQFKMQKITTINCYLYSFILIYTPRK